MSALWLALLLSASDAPAGEERTAAVFTAPTPVLLHASAYFIQRVTNVFVPLGVAFLANDIEWSLDAALLVIDGSKIEGPRGTVRYLGCWVAGGPVFRLSGRGLDGFFLSPRLTLGVFSFPAPGSPQLDFLVGAEIGYRFTHGRLYFAFVLGASVGVGLGETDIFAGPWLGAFSPTRNTQSLQPVVGLGLDVFRIGVTL